jgi:hypothetical protein
MTILTLFPLLFSMPAALTPAVPSPSTDALAVCEQLSAPGLAPDVLAHAIDAHTCAARRGELAKSAHPERLVVIDYSLPSTATRLWVIDLDQRRVLDAQRVAHGQGTGDDLASVFSNNEGSHQSSLGVFRTAETYIGEHGRSLRLDGLEPGFNDRARERTIVMHGADYVSDTFVAQVGRLGRSWGCPAVSNEAVGPLIDEIAGGTLVVSWYPDATWLHQSTFLHCDAS